VLLGAGQDGRAQEESDGRERNHHADREKGDQPPPEGARRGRQEAFAAATRGGHDPPERQQRDQGVEQGDAGDHQGRRQEPPQEVRTGQRHEAVAFRHLPDFSPEHFSPVRQDDAQGTVRAAKPLAQPGRQHGSFLVRFAVPGV
jgi:hypothetical protein